jgi:hypothetical protein
MAKKLRNHEQSNRSKRRKVNLKVAKAKEQGSLADFFAASPLCGSGLKIERAKDKFREDWSFD